MAAVGMLAEAGVKVGLAAGLALGAAAVVRSLHHTHFVARRGRTLKVLETVALGQNRAVHLVSVADRTLLLGATAGQITLLCEVAQPAGTEGEAAPVPQRAFAAVLARLLPRQEADGPSPCDHLIAAARAIAADSSAERKR